MVDCFVLEDELADKNLVGNPPRKRRTNLSESDTILRVNVLYPHELNTVIRNHVLSNLEVLKGSNAVIVINVGMDVNGVKELFVIWLATETLVRVWIGLCYVQKFIYLFAGHVHAVLAVN